MKSIKNKVFPRIYGRGWFFSSSDFIADFIADFSINNIDKALSSLVKKNKIRRIARGMYDYPKYSDFLNKELSPDIEKVAHAYARKFNWKIEASGDTALNISGLSNQVPGKYIYLSNGPNKNHQILDNISLEFKKQYFK